MRCARKHSKPGYLGVTIPGIFIKSHTLANPEEKTMVLVVVGWLVRMERLVELGCIAACWGQRDYQIQISLFQLVHRIYDPHALPYPI